MAQSTFTIHTWTADGPRPVWTGTPDSDDAPIAWRDRLRDEGPALEIGAVIDLDQWHYAEKVEPLRIAVTVPFNAPAFTTSQAEIVVTAYENGVLALLLTDLTGEALDPYEQEVLTVNLGGYGMIPPRMCVYIPDYGPHQGVAAALVEAGLGTIINPVAFGFGTGHLLRLEGDIATTSRRHDITPEKSQA